MQRLRVTQITENGRKLVMKLQQFVDMALQLKITESMSLWLHMSNE